MSETELFFGIKNFWFKVGVFAVVSAWAGLTAYLMFQNFYVTDPYDPAQTLTDAYGHNGAEAFKTFSTILLIEYLFLLAVLLPYSFGRRYWMRMVYLQAVAGGWFIFLALGAMHQGGVFGIHLLAVLIANALIFLFLVLSVIAVIVRRRQEKSNVPA